MKRPLLKTAAAVTVALCVSIGYADTVLIFDDLGLPDDTVISNQYAAQGVVFSPQDGQVLLRTATLPLFPNEPQGIAEIPYYTSVIIADFTPDATLAGAWIDFGMAGNGVKIEAFDGPGATGNLLASASTMSETYLGVTANGIASVRFSNVSDDPEVTWLLDHFTFELIPEPGTAALLVLGALAIGLRRRS